MFGIGMPELAVILVVALVVLGPRRLPELARTLGKGLAEFRKVTGDVNKELQGARDLIEREAREHERLGREMEREQRLATSGAEGSATPPKKDVSPATGAAPKTEPTGTAPAEESAGPAPTAQPSAPAPTSAAPESAASAPASSTPPGDDAEAKSGGSRTES